MVHVINDLLAPLVAGLDPFDVEKVHEAMAFIKGNLAAKGGIDVALWDIMARRAACLATSCWVATATASSRAGYSGSRATRSWWTRRAS